MSPEPIEPREIPSPEDCRHLHVICWTAEDKDVEPIWSCGTCLLRFYPGCPVCVTVGHREGRHPE